MGSARATMIAGGTLQICLFLFICKSQPIPAKNVRFRQGLPYIGGCVLCEHRIEEFGCDDITPENIEQCRRDACPRCQYWPHCYPDWCLPVTTTTSTTTTTATTSITRKTTTTTTPTTSSTTTTATTISTTISTSANSTTTPTDNTTYFDDYEIL